MVLEEGTRPAVPWGVWGRGSSLRDLWVVLLLQEAAAPRSWLCLCGHFAGSSFPQGMPKGLGGLFLT